MPMPRKLASRMKFVKNVRYTTFAAVPRISASSTNSIRKLATTRWSRRGSSADAPPSNGIGAS
jgi:hypothetical protein